MQRKPSKTQQRMLQPDGRQSERNHPDIHHNHNEITEVFVVDRGLDQECESTGNPALNQSNQKELSEINAELKPVVTVHHLVHHSGHYDEQSDHNLYQHQRAKFGCKKYPALRRKRIHNLADLGISLAPHQLA